MNKDVRAFVARISHIPGVEIVQGTKHLSVFNEGRLVTTLSATPSDHRWQRNALSVLRQAGITPAARPRKEVRYRDLMDVKTIRERIAALESKAAFARFLVNDVPTMEPSMLTFKNARSAETTVYRLAKEHHDPSPAHGLSPWAHELLDYALRRWDRIESQKRREREREREIEAELEAVAAAEVEDDDERAGDLVVRVDVARLVAALAELGVVVELEGGKQ